MNKNVFGNLMEIKHKNFLIYLWSIVVIIATSFIAIFIPIDLIGNLKTNDTYLTINMIVSFIFVIDIIINLNIGKRIGAEFHLDSDVVLRDVYIKKYLIWDIIAAIPIGLFLHPSVFQLLRLFKLGKVIQLLRIIRLREIQYSNALTMFFFFFWIAHFAHWIACGWLKIRGIDLSIGLTENYIKSLYWTITTITTVGYGDITPLNSTQMIYAMLVEILGVGVYGYIIGKVAGFLSKRDPSKSRYFENIERLTALVQQRNIPKPLQIKMRDYYTYVYRQKLGFDEHEFFKGLPTTLRTELSMALKKDVIEKIPLFNESSEEFIREIALHLKPIVITPGDYLLQKGEIGTDMYFVVKGELDVITENLDTISTLSEGDFFGEIALFRNIPRTATIRAKTYCDLYSLSKGTFDSVVGKYPKIKEIIKSKVEYRVKEIEDNRIEKNGEEKR